MSAVDERVNSEQAAITPQVVEKKVEPPPIISDPKVESLPESSPTTMTTTVAKLESAPPQNPSTSNANDNDKVESKPVQQQQPSKSKGYLKRYFAQSILTPEERKARLKDKPKDKNPFTMRAFLHDNLTQSIPRHAPPPASSTSKPKTKEPTEPEKPISEKVKEAFKMGVGETSEQPANSPATETPEADVQGPGKPACNKVKEMTNNF